jgi:hypothetical protein
VHSFERLRGNRADWAVTALPRLTPAEHAPRRRAGHRARSKTADIAAMAPIAPTLAARTRRRTNRAAGLDADLAVIIDETHHTLTGASQNSFDSIENLTLHAALGKV